MSRKLSVILILILITLLAYVSSAFASVGVHPNFSFALGEDGKEIIACLSADLPEGYHAYSNNPGEAGRPTSLRFVLGEGEPLPVKYPQGSVQRDYYDPNVSVNVYTGMMRLFVILPLDSKGKKYIADFSQLLCSSQNCNPIDMRLKGVVPSSLEPLEKMEWKRDWFDVTGQGERNGPVPGAPAPRSVESMDDNDPLPPPEDFSFSLDPRYADSSVEIYGIGKALILGILAGLLLNIMPCVLPVLTFKLSALLMASAGSKTGLSAFRQHNIFFTLGIMTLFTLLALILGVADLMWGQLYQSQSFLMVMLLLVFLMGLSMLGLFNLPVLDFKILSTTKSPRLQAYLTGLFSTFLATPCSGPLLGGVLGWAFTQSMTVLVIVFWSVGLGMSLPYILFCLFPNIVQVLPRPGAWMQVAEHIVGFAILATCLYLLSILPQAIHMKVLVCLLFVSFAAFLWGRFCPETASKMRRAIGSMLFVSVLVGTCAFALQPQEEHYAWTDFSPQEFISHLGKKPMLVEFTADWCPNCKFVESTVYTDKRMRKLEEKYGIDFIKVDLTGANAYGIKLLSMLGSRSIPVTALFPAGKGFSEPVVLRDVYTAETLEQVANRLYRNTKK